MLVLSRKPGQQIVIGDNITLHVISITKNVVRLGIVAPKETPILRHEICLKIMNEESIHVHDKSQSLDDTVQSITEKQTSGTR